jgi:hypothetical protein
MSERAAPDAPGDAVIAYKTILKRVLNNRPSGTRQRMANALGKNRSFVSQIANPAYPVPIPAQHLETIFEICHFSQDDRRDFLAAYTLAHPRRLALVGPMRRSRTISVVVPDLGDARRNRAIDTLIADLVRRIGRFADDTE